MSLPSWVPRPSKAHNLPAMKIPKNPGTVSDRRQSAGGVPSRVGGGTIKNKGALSFGNGRPRSGGGGATGSTKGFGGSVGNSGGPGFSGPKGPMSSSGGFREPGPGSRKGFRE